MKNKKLLYIAAFLLSSMAIITCGYLKFVSRTVIATLNFPDFTVEKLIRSNDNPFIKIVSVPLDNPEAISEYDMVLVRVHGSSMDKRHLEAIRSAIKEGIPVYSTESSNQEINSFSDKQLEYVSTLMENGSVKNYRSLFNYIRKEVDGKKFFNGKYEEAVIIPNDYFFHLGEDEFFATFEEYQKFYELSGKYKKDAPRIVLLSGNINMQNSNEEHMAALIHSLEKKGMNVYPVNSFGMKKISMIKAVSPNLIINRPHGRLVMGGGDAATKMLRELNVPVLAPVTVSESYEKWLTSKQGMESGGMTSMSIVMPELDGAIAPFAVAAQFERDGLKLFDAIPGHTEKFCRLVKNYTNLQQTPNDKKKIAIYYYKGVGKSAVSAADLEGVQSLFNTLKMLEKRGYAIKDLPESAEALEALIQRSGSVLGAYALGAYDEFLKNGNPALVDKETFNQWAEEQLPDKLREEMTERYGAFPGAYMSIEEQNKKFVAVARIEFGNVVILPQPMPGEGENIDKLVHGTAGAPAYPYVASYLWAKNGFKSDAIIHFGTHGSLEFIPGKQIALSDYDWSDALISDMPHFYIYTINNIGEGIIAKRRSYATLISHLTSPFMQGEVYGELHRLKQVIGKYESLENGSVKQGYCETIRTLAKNLNMLSALDIDSVQSLSSEDIDRIHQYVEEIDAAKVIDGLYTLGKPYSREHIENTTRLMSSDAVRYALAQIDVVSGKYDGKILNDIRQIANLYNPIYERIMRSIAKQLPSEIIFKEVIGNEHYQKFCQAVANEHKDQSQQMKMMSKMAHAAPTSTEKKNDPERELIDALKKLKETIAAIPVIRKNLEESTKAEEEALIDALNGGYVEPGSAGDPIVNPNAVPTGKNFYSINPETTPSQEAWKVGKRLAENLLETEFKVKGHYPEKVSFSLWATDFISSEGATVAQILYLLGVEPLRDGFGYIRSLQLIPAEQLGRPRIDVVVQTSGQLRDIAASRLELINRAVAMAAEDGCEHNFVRKSFADAERHLLDKGFSPLEARKYSRERIFGGAGGNYGTGIMGMVEKGDSWEEQSRIAEQYIENMGAIYSGNGGEEWGTMKKGVFEAALLNTSVVVQPRSSNTWGPLSLDHVYEFMGGMSAAVRQVTGNDPTGYFNDFRNTHRAKVQELKEAIGVETNSTLFNPKYITQMLKGESSAMDHFAETFRNTFGWNAMKPTAIDQHIWNKYHDIYVKDELNLNIRETFSRKNPYALQEMTAVMLESARKEMWKASSQQIEEVAALHGELVKEHNAGCSGFICDNGKLRDFIAQNLSPEAAKQYGSDIKAAREIRMEKREDNKNMVLKKEDATSGKSQENAAKEQEKEKGSLVYIIATLLLIGGSWLILKNKWKR